MKKAWYSRIEGLKGPLVMYFMGMILLGVGNSFTSSNEIVTNTLEALKYTGGLIKTLFPFFLVINVIGKAHEDSVPILGGVFSYIIMHLTTMYVAPQNLSSSYYSALGDGLLNIVGQDLNKAPINLGLIASILAIVMVTAIYKLSRQRFNYGIFTFIDNDTWFIIMIIIASILSGVLLSWGFRYVVNTINTIMTFISGNSTNPAALFIYGLLERVMEILNLDEIVHSSFWTGLFGGSWVDSAGVTYYGDVNIWTAQIAQGSVQLGVGKYISPYYIINIFVVPAMIIALLLQYTNRIERNRIIGLAILAILVSLSSGCLLPLEYLLLLTAPALLICLIVLTSGLYLVMAMMEVYLGFSFSGALVFATPGTLLEFTKLSSYLGRNTSRSFVWIGIIAAIIAFAMVFLYYYVLAFDFMDPTKRKMHRKEIIRALGGLGNIRIVDASPSRISVAVMDTHKIKPAVLMNLGAYEVREAFFCHYVYFGPASLAIAREIRKELKNYNKITKFIEAK